MTLRLVMVPVAGRKVVQVSIPTGARLLAYFVGQGTATWKIYDASGNWIYTAGTSRGTTLAGESWQFDKGMFIECSDITKTATSAGNVVSIAYDDRDVVQNV